MTATVFPTGLHFPLVFLYLYLGRYMDTSRQQSRNIDVRPSSSFLREPHTWSKEFLFVSLCSQNIRDVFLPGTPQIHWSLACRFYPRSSHEGRFVHQARKISFVAFTT